MFILFTFRVMAGNELIIHVHVWSSPQCAGIARSLYQYKLRHPGHHLNSISANTTNMQCIQSLIEEIIMELMVIQNIWIESQGMYQNWDLMYTFPLQTSGHVCF